jgi:hypothetical protein
MCENLGLIPAKMKKKSYPAYPKLPLAVVRAFT